MSRCGVEVYIQATSQTDRCVDDDFGPTTTTTYPLIRHTRSRRYNATKIITNSLLERSRGRDGVRDLWVDVIAYGGGGAAGSTEFTGVLDKCFVFFPLFFFYR